MFFDGGEVVICLIVLGDCEEFVVVFCYFGALMCYCILGECEMSLILC